MKRQLSLTLALCLGSTAFACGDDSGSDTDTTSTEDSGVDASTDTDTTPTDTTPTDTTPTDTTPTDTTPPDSGTDTTTPPDSGTDTSTSSGPDGGGDGGPSGSDAGDAGSFMITSPTLSEGDAFAAEYTCEAKTFGDGYSPELDWDGAPQSTVVYALVLKDTSLEAAAPQYAFHWAAWNIPVSVTGIPEHLSAGDFPAELDGGEQFRAGPPHDNEFFGPCPSWQTACFGNARSNDHYSFTLYAFDAELAPPAQADEPNYVATLAGYFAQNAIAMTELHLTSDAAPADASLLCPPETDGGTDGGTLGDASTPIDMDSSTGPAADAGDAGDGG